MRGSDIRTVFCFPMSISIRECPQTILCDCSGASSTRFLLLSTAYLSGCTRPLRPSIAPERLLRALSLQSFYSILS